ncbi:PREDICTED: kremen protein 1 [Galeopterus variegatus]|uniref:Kremen protein 1 n=1 Tax=Galeopterus variegatus TaxID=482537 RepID=A0ABM0QI56_GALVR|nr:PREDICTED: kremen protein 1 [Galeopterus variegatus]
MESGYACFCGNNPDYWKYGEAASTECNSVCFGDHTQPCGGDGRIILFDTLVGACGGNYSAMTSVVYSPDFPDTYATGRVCYWTIRVPGASHIHFNFTLFDIRDSTDMVELLDGYTHHVLVRFDGRNRPPLSFNVSLDFVILYFFSDRINQAQGFAVLYQAVKEEPPQERPTINQTLAEVITEQANLSISAARSSKVLYVITTSPSHPPQTVPGWTVYGLATLLILTVTAIIAKILLHVTFNFPAKQPWGLTQRRAGSALEVRQVSASSGEAVKEEPPQERPTINQTLAEVITEQANLSISAARSSKVLYVITTSPSHPPQTVPGWTVYGLATLLILTVTAIIAKILLHVTFNLCGGTLLQTGMRAMLQGSTRYRETGFVNSS